MVKHFAVLALGLTIYLHSNRAEADDIVQVCNSSDELTLNLATANNYWVGGSELWRESGWYTVAPGRCENMRSVRPHHEVGYALMLIDNGNTYNPRVEFNWTDSDFLQRAKYDYTARMCIGTSQFSISRKAKAQVGKNCWDDNSLSYSFYVTGGDKGDTWVFKIDPDQLAGPNNRVTLNGEFGVNNDPAFSAEARTPSIKSCESENARDCGIAADKAYTRGGKQDLVQARELYKLSCDGNFGLACGRFALMLRQGQGGEKDLVLARDLLTSACEGKTRSGTSLGLSTADSQQFCTEAGEMYRSGEGGDINNDLYKKYYMRGCDFYRPESELCKDLVKAYEQEPWEVWDQ